MITYLAKNGQELCLCFGVCLGTWILLTFGPLPIKRLFLWANTNYFSLFTFATHHAFQITERRKGILLLLWHGTKPIHEGNTRQYKEHPNKIKSQLFSLLLLFDIYFSFRFQFLLTFIILQLNNSFGMFIFLLTTWINFQVHRLNPYVPVAKKERKQKPKWWLQRKSSSAFLFFAPMSPHVSTKVVNRIIHNKGKAFGFS